MILRSTSLVLLCGLAGCAHLEPLWPRHAESEILETKSWSHDRPVTIRAGRRATAEFDAAASRLDVQVTRKKVCMAFPSAHTETRRRLTYSPRWPMVGTWYGVGAATLIGGMSLAISGRNRPDLFDPFSRGDLSREGAYLLGGGLATLGIGAIAAATLAVATEDEEVEVVDHETFVPEEPTWDCGERPEPGVVAVLNIWDGTILESTTDDRGKAPLEVPKAALVKPRDDRPWATLRVANTAAIDVVPEAGVLQEAPVETALVKSVEEFGGTLPSLPALIRTALGDAVAATGATVEAFAAGGSAAASLIQKDHYLEIIAPFLRYSVKDKRAELSLGENSFEDAGQARPAGSFEQFYMVNLPTKEVAASDGRAKAGGRRETRILLPIALPVGMKLQKAKADLRVFTIFRPRAMEDVSFKFVGSTAPKPLKTQRRLLACDVSALVFVDGSSNEMIYRFELMGG